VILLDRQRADVAPIVVGADLRQAYEVEIRYPFGSPLVVGSIPAGEVLLPDT